MESLPTIVPTDVAVDQSADEHHFSTEPFVFGSSIFAQARCSCGWLAPYAHREIGDRSLEAGERVLERARADWKEHAPLGQAPDGEVVHTFTATHRRIVADDLVALGEHAADLIDETGCRPGDPTWEVLRNAHDTTLSLAELINAARSEGRDITALGEHALLVLGAAVTALAPKPDADEAALDERIIRAIFELPQTTAEVGEVLDVDGEVVEAALQRLADQGRIGVTKVIGRQGVRWVASA